MQTKVIDEPSDRQARSRACRLVNAHAEVNAVKTDGWKANLGRALASVLLAFFFCAPGNAAPKYKILHAFGKGNDGAGLWSPVTLDNTGNLYGATSGGGKYGYGTVFELTPHPNGHWSETILHSFGNSYDPGGSEPNGGLVQDASGNWYGTTWSGGDYAYGTVFELAGGPGDWSESVLYSFGAKPDDGGDPVAGTVMDGSGNLYGTASTTAYELSLDPDTGSWSETILHRFGIKTGDGAAPYAGLILDTSGNLYGTTESGGIGCAGEGCGTVYELEHTANGWAETILHYFDNNDVDGYTPGNGALFMDSQGQLYGTTESGGSGTGSGTVFRLTPEADGHWKETILYSFNSSGGSGPAGGVVMDNYGSLYGTATSGGAPGCGVVYKLAPGPKDKWTYTVLHTFGYGNDGCMPTANLILDSQGNLYGDTAIGGAYGAGTVFELTP